MGQSPKYLQVHEEMMGCLRRASSLADRLKKLDPTPVIAASTASTPVPVQRLPENEDELIGLSKQALSVCNWEIGSAAASWTKRFARGRSDADFGALIGLSGDQVYQRRRVWESFSDVYERYSELTWSHFYAAMGWDDANLCLQWAQDMSATVAEMKAWRRAQHREDLSALE